MSSSCIFCKIIKGEIPCFKIYESKHVISFMDINPIAEKHALVIPKSHAQFLHQVPDEAMAEIGIALKKVSTAIGAKEYNVLQNNGRLAHQEVDHVHFHVIPKTVTDGLIVDPWKQIKLSDKMKTLVQFATEIKDAINDN